MAADYYTILTAQGRAKFAAAVANNTPLNLTAMAVGDSNGTGYAPTDGQTALTHETYRAPLNQLVQDVGNPNWFVAEMVIPDTVGGFTVREVGLYDNTNTLIAIGRFPDSFKPTLPSGSNKQLYIRMVFEVTNATSVTLLVDPSIVMATQTYVQNEIKKAVNALDFKNSVRAVATSNVALTGLQTIDTVSLVAGNRVLLAGQTDTKQNGIYIVAAGAWVRSTDADENYEVTAEMMMAVEEGTVNASTLWQLTSNMPLTIGTSALTFEKTGGVSGAIPGTYRSVTVDKFGRVIAGTNPTTLAAYGVTDGVTQVAIQNQTHLAVTTAGTAPTYTGSVTPAPAALADGLRVRAKFHASTTAASTLNLNALGAKSIKQTDSTGVLVDAVLFANQLADLEYDGTNWVVLDPAPAARGYVKFTSNGSFTVPAGVATVYVSLCGGGGGGAGGAGSGYNYGAGGGGGAAAYLKQPVTVTAGAVVNITIGAGGAGAAGSTGSVFTNGSAGGISAFGTFLSASGAGGGSITVGGANGGSSGGAGGNAGGSGLAIQQSNDGHGGVGGSCLLGVGAPSGHGASNPVGYGAGGAGGRSFPNSGGNGTAGAAGVCIVEW